MPLTRNFLLNKSMVNDNIDISIVIAAYNEEENLRPLVSEILDTIGKTSLKFEIVLVDDGSTDSSGEIINNISAENKLVQAIHLECRSGQTSALDAGFRTSRGSLIAMMDADLQNDPRDIPALVTELRKGSLDLVCGWRYRRNDTWVKRASSRIANSARNYFTHDGIHDTGCTLKVFRNKCLSNIKLFEGMHRFLPALFQMEGFRVGELKVNHRRRTRGKTKYSITNRLFVSLADLFAVKWMMKRHLRYLLKPGVKPDTRA